MFTLANLFISEKSGNRCEKSGKYYIKSGNRDFFFSVYAPTLYVEVVLVKNKMTRSFMIFQLIKLSSYFCHISMRVMPLLGTLNEQSSSPSSCTVSPLNKIPICTNYLGVVSFLIDWIYPWEYCWFSIKVINSSEDIPQSSSLF